MHTHTDRWPVAGAMATAAAVGVAACVKLYIIRHARALSPERRTSFSSLGLCPISPDDLKQVRDG